MSRVFWQRCDDVLAPGTAFTAIHDRIAQIRTVTRSLDAGTVPEAMAAYQRMGWGADAADGRVVLVTGEGVDALEVPRATGVLAIRWWLYTGGRADEIRQLPSLPNPAEALAVIASANRHFFLAQSGAFPWAGPVAARADAGRTAPGPEVRWHTGGSRIPAPPSLPDTGHLAEWASRPPARMRLADPVVLLDLLSRVTVMTGHQDQALTMPGGLRVVPAE